MNRIIVTLGLLYAPLPVGIHGLNFLLQECHCEFNHGPEYDNTIVWLNSNRI